MKRILSAIAAFTMALSLAPAQPTATINLLNHNIHSGGRAVAAANHIEDPLKEICFPAVIRPAQRRAIQINTWDC